MKRFAFSAIFVAIMVAVSSLCANAQSFSTDAKRTYKPTKEVKKEAKKYEKDGWKVAFGSMPMAEQMQRAIYFQNEVDGNGQAKYAIGRGQTTAEYIDAARLQAMEFARLQIANQLETELTAEAKNVFGNEQGEQVTSVMQTSVGGRSVVTQKLSQTVVVTEIQRELPNGLKEVQSTIAADGSQVLKAEKKAIREEVKKRGNDIVEELDKKGWE